MAGPSAPTAQGSFEKTPCAHVLVYIRERQLSGSLVVHGDEGKAVYAFDRGFLAQAKLPPNQLANGASPDRLGEVMLEMGLIRREALLESATRMARGDGLQGAILLAMSACSATALEKGLREQLARKGTRLFSQDPSSTYEFYQDQDLLEGFGGERIGIDIFAMIWRGVRATRQDAAIEKIFAKVAGKNLRMRVGTNVQQFGFEPEMTPMLALITRGISAEDYLRRAVDVDLSRKLLYVLLIGQCIEFLGAAPPRATQSAPALPRAEPPPAPPVQTPSLMGRPLVAEPVVPAVGSRTSIAARGTASDAIDLPVPPRAAPSIAPQPPVKVIKLPTTKAPFRSGVVPQLDEVFAEARREGASDLHLVAERPPLFRRIGELVPRGQPLDPEAIERIVMPIVPAELRAQLEEEGSCDFALEHEQHGRFRVNVSRQRTGLKACFRLIGMDLPTLASLGLPDEIAVATHHHQGLIVVAGPTGHGKTSTLTALIDLVNRGSTHHIITVEDPVEYVHPRAAAMMSQREVGTNTRTFAAALKASLREDPDVIAIGELRDTETVRMALAASETGHLVIATMNTPSAAKTIERIIDLFPPADQPQVRATLAGGLRLVVSQRLVPRIDRTGLAAAVEILPGSVPLWTLIRDGKTYQIPSLQQRGKALGIVRLDDSLADLVRANVVSFDDAKHFAENPDDFEGTVKGKLAADAAPPPETAKPAAEGGLLSRAGSIFGKKG